LKHFCKAENFTEAPDITARICGICPIAYQMSSANAMEMACGIKIEGPLRAICAA
jgi:sulfhydrogenase subunit alpha